MTAQRKIAQIQKARRSMIALALGSLGLMTLPCATVAQQADVGGTAGAAEPAMSITSSGAGGVNLADYPLARVHVTFNGSPTLSTLLMARLQGLGVQTVDSPSQADITIAMEARYRFQRPHARPQEVDFGEAAERNPNQVVASQAATDTQGPHIELAPTAQVLRGNLSANVAFGVGLVDTVLSMTGARGWFNRLVAGDERGFCLGTPDMCKDWKKYEQTMTIAASITLPTTERQLVGAKSSAKSEALVPQPLFDAAMREITPRLVR